MSEPGWSSQWVWCLKTRSPIGVIDCIGLGIMSQLEDMCHWGGGGALRVGRLASSSLSLWFLLGVQYVSPQLPDPDTLPSLHHHGL